MIEERITLNNGITMPKIGYGVFRMTDAEACEEAVVQVVLRWLTQRGIVPIVKSANPQRMKKNLSIFDFALTEAEIRQIAALDTGHTCFVPRQTGSAVDEFLEKSLLYQL